MLRLSRVCPMRMPKSRRPRERPWEVFNTRDYGFNEGSQNYYMWVTVAAAFLSLLGVEVYQLAQRVLARGDTCPACDAARAHYRARVEAREVELKEIDRREKMNG
ncbi:hypothetical protein AGDE_00490 [Angomonas deanei]|nr:hypothetical protein AGDE_00490 [Angomonas deanei]|eukprot:EPY43431.1 hypothetical protein AGDE_00490 [Angomonas deanei]